MFDHDATESIRISGLKFEARDKTLIDIPTLSLSGQGTTVFMGPNGAGKSLLLRLMHGLLEPPSGSIQCFGLPISPEVTKQQALVFQTPVLLRRTAEDNLRFVLKVRRQPLDETGVLLRKVGLEGKRRTPARRLSGGERQRLAVAVALATKPKLLFLDEPTASLDPTSVQAIEAIVAEAVSTGVKVVWVTHDAGQARRLADDIVFLSNGRAVEHTPARQFFETPETKTAQDYLAGRLNIGEV